MYKLISMVGWTGETTPGTGQALWIAEIVATGARFLVRSTGDGGTNRFVPCNKATIETQIRNNDGAFAAAVSWASLVASPAVAVGAVGGAYEFVNATTAQITALVTAGWTKMFAAFRPFDLKADNVGDLPADRRVVNADNAAQYFAGILPAPSTPATIGSDALSSTSGTGTGTGTGAGAGAGKPTEPTGIAALDGILVFFWENPILMVAGTVLLLDAFGITNITGGIMEALGLKKGKGKGKRRR